MKLQEIDRIQTSPGHPSPFGATRQENGVNFAIVTKRAAKLSLLLFHEKDLSHPFKEIALDPKKNKTGDVWHIHISGIPSDTLYAYRLWAADSTPESLILLDPYAKQIQSDLRWGELSQADYRPLGKIVSPSDFDWQNDARPLIPASELIIYEMHIRGFTQDPSSHAHHPGSFLGVVEKIPYLKNLGINAVEILPIHEFNEEEVRLFNLKSQDKLSNYFGYSTVNFFSPMNRYATSVEKDTVLREFKTMVREFHKNEIEVILDVVYNHTSEGNHKGPITSYRGLDPHAYYMIDAGQHYLNFSGCGNTFNANHPIAAQLILDSLRYWVTEMHVDGFRFDLASILTRGQNGAPLNPSPIVEAISLDPLLAQTKLIAEAWDAGGLYQVGRFYPGTRWLEWNGRYRDSVRRFIKGTPKYKTLFATALCGSQDLYGWDNRSPTCSVNFVTSHDGFTLSDLVSYNEKHNKKNGENNQDGSDHNDSWNCGIEGVSNNKAIISLREKQMRNFVLALMISQGIPMMTMGDEYGHTKYGNNNTWCQDNALNWFQWNELEINSGLYRFFRSLIHFRKTHPELKHSAFLQDKDITWHGLRPNHPDWDSSINFIAFTLNVRGSPSLYIAFNATAFTQTVIIPDSANNAWRLVVNTHNTSPNDFYEKGDREKLSNDTLLIPPYSAILLEAIQNTSST